MVQCNEGLWFHPAGRRKR
nr:hypothetical protein [Rhizobium sullae]